MANFWETRLKDGFTQGVGRNIRLPSEEGLEVCGGGDSALIKLKASAPLENMQTNQAAFEGWSLALHRWAGARQITLCWDEPNDSPPQSAGLTDQQRHYQRFLFRVERFAGLFDWFHVGNADPFKDSLVLHRTGLFLNASNGPRRASRPDATRGTAEDRLERHLCATSTLNCAFGLSPHAIKDRQIPVGLFSSNPPSKRSGVFPGGKGAIDLACIDGTNLWLFELKAEENISVGTLTEIFFYTALVREAVMRRISFCSSSRDSFSTRLAIQPISSITGVMLGHKLHPLVNDLGLLDLLNTAAAKRWNQEGNAPRVSFNAATITQDNEHIMPLVKC